MEKSKSEKNVKNQKNIVKASSRVKSDKVAESKAKGPGKTVIVKYPGFVWRFILIFILAVMLSILVFIAVKKFTAVKKEKHVMLVENQLSFCSELVSGKYRYSDVIALKKKSGLARSYSIVKYSGIIRAGLNDVDDIVYEVDSSGKSILLKVPPAVLLGNEVCSQEVFDEKQSIFVPITTKEIFDEIETAKDETVANIIEDGLLEESWEYACSVIQQFMYGCGFEKVRVVKLR